MKTKQKKFIIITIALLAVAAVGVSVLILNTEARPLAPGEQHATNSPFSPIINEQFPSEVEQNAGSSSNGNS